MADIGNKYTWHAKPSGLAFAFLYPYLQVLKTNVGWRVQGQ